VLPCLPILQTKKTTNQYKMNEEQFCEFFTNHFGERITNINQVSGSFDGEELFEFVNQAINKSKELNNGEKEIHRNT
jgi:hypothetical protein